MVDKFFGREVPNIDRFMYYKTQVSSGGDREHAKALQLPGVTYTYGKNDSLGGMLE